MSLKAVGRLAGFCGLHPSTELPGVEIEGRVCFWRSTWNVAVPGVRERSVVHVEHPSESINKEPMFHVKQTRSPARGGNSSTWNTERAILQISTACRVFHVKQLASHRGLC